MAKKAAAKPETDAKRPTGRPTSYNPVTAERICSLIAQGRSKRYIETLEGMPCRETIDNWLLVHEGFFSQYARACEIRAEGFAEEIVEIADTEKDAAIARNRIDARKWTASKLLARYSDSMTLKGDPRNPLQIAKPVDLDDARLLAIAAGKTATLDG